jgi:hypothetical protein
VSRLIARNVVDVFEKARQDAAVLEVMLDEVLAGDGKHSLDYKVVQGQALRKECPVLGGAAQGARDPIQLPEDLSEPLGQIRVDGA